MCKIMQEICDEARMEGEIKQARRMAFKLATRGESLDEISDIVGYDVKTVKTWLGNQKSENSVPPSMQV